MKLFNILGGGALQGVQTIRRVLGQPQSQSVRPTPIITPQQQTQIERASNPLNLYPTYKPSLIETYLTTGKPIEKQLAPATTPQTQSSGGQPTGPSSGEQPRGEQPQAGAPTSDISSLYAPSPAAPQIDYNALIAPALEGLEAAIAPLQQETATTISGIEAQRGAGAARTQAEIGTQERTLERAKTAQQQLGESAAEEARRQFAEIQQGLQARYGGTTGTGRFAAEYAGTQTLRNIANIRQQVGNALLQLDDKLVQVQEIGRIALQDLEDQTRTQIQQAKDRLALNLADVRRQKGELQARKAELASQAIQLYQNAVNQVNQQNAAFRQNLFLQQQDAENKLQLARQRAQEIASRAPLYQFRTFQKTPIVFNPRTGEARRTTIPGLQPGTAPGLSTEDLIDQILEERGLG